MQTFPPVAGREPHFNRLDADLIVVGGGLAGTCCAIDGSRRGLSTVLVQDRPVLGGNASSEVRLWVLGATAHMENNNRWAREGGVVDELLVENMYRNPEGNALIFDTILLEKCRAEPNLTLLLNTAAFETAKRDADTIASVRAFCSQNSTMYELHAPLFCDASGDGILGFLAGAAFRMGAEAAEEFDESFAPEVEYGELLGHSIYFYTKDVGHPVTFVPPSFALEDVTQIPKYRSFNTKVHGCRLWWIEYGGRLDTVHETEQIKWELWKVVYGVWNHIKNSGEFPDAETLTLEWVGTVPGKRESRRFEGDYMIRQRDFVEQRTHEDAVSFGGWAVDLHPADGVFSDKPGCTQWHSKGLYQIPYRCMYSRNISNLFLAGRLLSASHVAFGSTRVMATCAHNAQAVAAAAAICKREGCLPREVNTPPRMKALQRDLVRTGQFIPGVNPADEADLASTATVSSSSALALGELTPAGASVPLDVSRAMLLPVAQGPMPALTFDMEVSRATELRVELRASSRPGNFTPDEVLATATQQLATNQGKVKIDFNVTLDGPRYLAICFLANPAVSIATSDHRLTGVLAVRHTRDHTRPSSDPNAVTATMAGFDEFEFWPAERRPGGHNFALVCEPALQSFAAKQATHAPDRPSDFVNAWVADLGDHRPWLQLDWPNTQRISSVGVTFDPDFDYPMESVLMGHPERVMPFMVRDARLLDDRGQVIAALHDNHQTHWRVQLREPVVTRSLRLEVKHPSATVPAAVFRFRVFTDPF